jgi:hypothetical protein
MYKYLKLTCTSELWASVFCTQHSIECFNIINVRELIHLPVCLTNKANETQCDVAHCVSGTGWFRVLRLNNSAYSIGPQRRSYARRLGTHHQGSNIRYQLMLRRLPRGLPLGSNSVGVTILAWRWEKILSPKHRVLYTLFLLLLWTLKNTRFTKK